MAQFTFGDRFASAFQSARQRSLRRQMQRARQRLEEERMQQNAQLTRERLAAQEQRQEDRQAFEREQMSRRFGREEQQRQQNTVSVPRSTLGLEGEGSVPMSPGQWAQFRATQIRNAQRGDRPQSVNLRDLGYDIDADIPVSSRTLPFIIQRMQQNRGTQMPEAPDLNQLLQDPEAQTEVPRSRAPAQRFGRFLGDVAETVSEPFEGFFGQELGQEGRQVVMSELQNVTQGLSQLRDVSPEQRRKAVQQARARLTALDRRLRGYQQEGDVPRLRQAARTLGGFSQALLPESQQADPLRQGVQQTARRLLQQAQTTDDIEQLTNVFSELRKLQQGN